MREIHSKAIIKNIVDHAYEIPSCITSFNRTIQSQFFSPNTARNSGIEAQFRDSFSARINCLSLSDSNQGNDEDIIQFIYKPLQDEVAVQAFCKSFVEAVQNFEPCCLSNREAGIDRNCILTREEHHGAHQSQKRGSFWRLFRRYVSALSVGSIYLPLTSSS